MTVTAVRRYRGPLGGALALVLVGILLGEPWIVSLAGVPVAFAAYGSLAGVPDPSIAVEREVEPEQPIPAERVRVRLTVANESDQPLPDVRVVDGVPPDLEVVDGSPRGALAIRPNDVATLEYELEARRGEHVFDDPRVRVRGVSGGSYRDVDPPVTGDERVNGRVFVEEPPTRRETATLVGAVATDVGGSGVEFHTTREYRPGDPVNRIDWRRLARNGDLSTVNFREHRGVAVVVVADCRPLAGLAPANGNPVAADLVRYAADRMLHAFVDGGTDAGAAVLKQTPRPWIEPGANNVLARSRAALRGVDEGGKWGGPRLRLGRTITAERLVERLSERLPAGGQVVFVTALTDDLPIDVARGLEVRGNPVTVVAPDAGDPETPGERAAALDRETRLLGLRDVGAEVVDWHRSDPLPLAVEAAEVRT